LATRGDGVCRGGVGPPGAGKPRRAAPGMATTAPRRAPDHAREIDGRAKRNGGPTVLGTGAAQRRHLLRIGGRGRRRRCRRRGGRRANAGRCDSPGMAGNLERPDKRRSRKGVRAAPFQVGEACGWRRSGGGRLAERASGERTGGSAPRGQESEAGGPEDGCDAKWTASMSLASAQVSTAQVTTRQVSTRESPFGR